ncbi:MAG: RNA polymerase sigma factor [Blastocatellia bacterium]
MSKSPASETESKFNSIVEEYGRFLRQTILRVCPRDLGLQFDEIEQEARLRIWKALESEREIRDLTSYLYRIAVSATLDAVRRVKRKREEQLVLEAEDDSPQTAQSHHLQVDSMFAPDIAASRKQTIQRVKEAMARLPDNRRQAVSLHLQGMTTQEIAALLDWTEPKARNLVYRGLNDLRQSLKESGIDYEID